MRVLIAVTHLLGTGHLARATALAEAFAAAGHEALIVSGGMPAPHLAPGTPGAEIAQLPPLCSDGVNFTRLLDADGQVADDGYLAARRTVLLDALDRFAPDALITELFPFGRRVLADEFEALLSAARARTPRPLIFASIRDVLAPPSSEKKAAQTGARLCGFYDGVLVHGDAAITPLEASWPVTADIAAMLRYTGFISPPLPSAGPAGDGAGEVLVTAGGGPVGDGLFESALGAAASDERVWRLLVGGGDREARIARLKATAPANAIVEPVRPDFRELLQRAVASVSQAGYNTMMDLAAIGLPAVIAPFEEGGETEQRQRAEAFAERFPMTVVPEAELSPVTLGAALHEALSARAGERPAIDLDGARRSVEIVADAVARGSA